MYHISLSVLIGETSGCVSLPRLFICSNRGCARNFDKIDLISYPFLRSLQFSSSQNLCTSSTIYLNFGKEPRRVSSELMEVTLSALLALLIELNLFRITRLNLNRSRFSSCQRHTRICTFIFIRIHIRTEAIPSSWPRDLTIPYLPSLRNIFVTSKTSLNKSYLGQSNSGSSALSDIGDAEKGSAESRGGPCTWNASPASFAAPGRPGEGGADQSLPLVRVCPFERSCAKRRKDGRPGRKSLFGPRTARLANGDSDASLRPERSVFVAPPKRVHRNGRRRLLSISRVIARPRIYLLCGLRLTR